MKILRESNEAAHNILKGIEIFGVSNQPFIDGSEYIGNHTFPPVILLTCDYNKYLIIEGHSRMTIYGMVPDKLNVTNAFVGYTSREEMEKYDSRMV